MPLIDDLRQPLPEDELSRRRLLTMLGGGALTVAGAGTIVTGIQFMSPNVLFEPATRFPVGRPEDLPLGGVLDLPRQKLFVAHGDEGYYAMSAVCTHLGCMVKHQGKQAAGARFFCPCHGSRFDFQGNVVGGPAPRPLDRWKLEVEGGRLVVDTSAPVPPGTAIQA